MTDATYYERPDIWGADSVANPGHEATRLAATFELLGDVPDRLLDVGAGDGRWLRHLLGAGAPREAMLATDRSLAAMAHLPVPGTCQSSCDALPFADRSVSTVTVLEVLEHLPGSVYQAALTEIARVAANQIVVTVPNRENRRRAALRCDECGCIYNPFRHLRSFSPPAMSRLFEGFEMVRTVEMGPRSPFYPRPVRLLAERMGILRRPGSPTCPQCGTLSHLASAARPGDGEGRALADAGYGVARRFVPKSSRRYWLGAVYRRPA